MKKNPRFSNFDVFSIVKELDQVLSQGFISNIYKIEDLLIIRINTKNKEKNNLIVKNDTRINLTDFDYPIPKYPTNYIISLRKFLKNRKIISISQHHFDRIIIFELSNFEGESWKFIIELFNKGNFLLLDERNIIKIAKSYKKFKDRDILANREYEFPKTRGKDFLTINQDEFNELILNSNDEIVRILARNINISGLYSEEICYRAKIDKIRNVDTLSKDDLKNLYKSFKSLRNQLFFNKIKANIIFNDDGEQINVHPFDLEIFKNFKKKYFNSFNQAVDEFYSKIDALSIKTPHDEGLTQQIKTHRQILKKQQEYLEELKDRKKRYYEFGEFIYTNFNSIQKLFDTILNAQKKGYSLEEINKKLQSAKKEELDELDIFIKIIAVTKQIVININNEEVYLDLKKSVGENANIIYTKGKKLEKKIKGTIPAIEKSKKLINDLMIKKEALEAEVDFLIKKPKKKWFEKFRWFKSSDGFLIIGGRDASSNELIFKKYIDSNDLVFHAVFPGSPLAVIKNPENETIPDMTIKETADFIASFSRAWKENWGAVDVFYVKPDQISKSPPSGEYLPKGSFIISGKKFFIKNAKTELAIGLELIEIKDVSYQRENINYPKLIIGPVNAMKSHTNKIITIIPSKSGLKKGTLAKEIKSIIIKNAEKKNKKWIKLLSLDELNLSLPSGASIIKEII